MKGQLKKLKREQRQNELLSLFQGDFYQERKVGDNWYVKMWNGGTNKWQVAVFTIASFNNYKAFSSQRKEEKETYSKERNIDHNFKRPTLESVKKMHELSQTYAELEQQDSFFRSL